MAKFLKGLYTDSVLQDTPEGAYVFAKNIVDGNIVGSKENEDGFINAGILAPYTVIGVSSVGVDSVVFSTDNVNSEIGKIVRSSGVLTYSTIYNDAALTFNTSNPIIDIEYRIDVNNQRTVAWTDNLNPPRLINIDNPPATGNIQELNIFRDINNPALTSYGTTDTGGSLKTGSYIVLTKYRNTLDLAETNWFIHDHVFYINNDPLSGLFATNAGSVGGQITSKTIFFTLQNSDTRYDTIIVGVVYSDNGILTASEVMTVTNSSTVNVSITGGESTSSISLDSVVTPTTSYATAKSLTQLAGKLFLANLTTDPFPILQQTCLSIQVSWSSSLINAVNNVGSHKDQTPPTFMPGEVYALYLGVELNKGGWRCYHIPGRAPNAGDKDAVSNYGLNYTKFQVDDTITGSNMGYWENSNETYPTTSDYNNGIVDLRGLPVRHHRMPSLTYLAENTYAGSSAFGVSQLPLLTINVNNVIIPAPVQAEIKRWKIFYAKKTTSNSLVIGSDLMQYAFKSTAFPAVSASTGGNWYIQPTHVGWSAFDQPDTTKVRCHSLDYLYNRATPTPNYVRYAYKLRSASMKYTGAGTQYMGFGTVGNISVTGGSRGTVASAVIDYTVSNTTRSAGSQIAGLTNFTFLPQTSLNGADTNAYNEANFVATLAPGFSPTTLITFNQVATRGVFEGSQDNQFDRFGFSNVDTLLAMYYLQLSSVHVGLSSQTLIPMEGYAASSSTSGSFSGGDGFISYMSFMTAAPLCANPVGNLGNPTLEGLRMWFGYIGYSRNNWNMRYQTQGNVDTYFHPKTDARTLVTPSLLQLLNPADPFNAPSGESSLYDLSTNFVNTINYNVDYSLHNELNVPVIFDPRVVNQTQLPNTIIFTPTGSEESQVTSWKTFLSGDRYVMPKNKGYIVNLQGVNNKTLLIHTQFSLFRTRTDIQMSTSGNSDEAVFFKSASIFTLPPEEVLPNKAGYAGTQHKQSCRLTKAGYFFLDNNQGKCFLYTGELQEISSNGLRNFFKNFTNISPDSDNAFVSNGFTVGYDERNNRLLISKNADPLSWTLSYNPATKVWVSYHDYIPDQMWNTVDNVLYSLKDNVFYIHNIQNNIQVKGVYYGITVNPSYIDIPFNVEPTIDKLFTTINWITELSPNSYTNGQSDTSLNYAQTFTHITLRGLDHCTGRVALIPDNDFTSLYNSNLRNLNRTWHFNSVRDIVLQPGFVKGFYDNYNIDVTKLDTNPAWYNERRFIDKFVICRLEYDNVANNRCVLVDASMQAIPVSR